MQICPPKLCSLTRQQAALAQIGGDFLPVEQGLLVRAVGLALAVRLRGLVGVFHAVQIPKRRQNHIKIRQLQGAVALLFREQFLIELFAGLGTNDVDGNVLRTQARSAARGSQS